MANGHGGRRSGAGRKKGSPNKRQSRQAFKAKRIVEKRGRDPLDVIGVTMDMCMRYAMAATDAREQLEYLKEASSQARLLAPFIHPMRQRVDGSLDHVHRHEDVFERMERRIEEARRAAIANDNALDEDEDLRDAIERAGGGASAPDRG